MTPATRSAHVHRAGADPPPPSTALCELPRGRPEHTRAEAQGNRRLHGATLWPGAQPPAGGTDGRAPGTTYDVGRAQELWVDSE
jgi:hypothetical protein